MNSCNASLSDPKEWSDHVDHNILSEWGLMFAFSTVSIVFRAHYALVAADY